MLHKLDKYLLSQFFTVLTMSLLGFLAVFLVVDLIENLDRFVDNRRSNYGHDNILPIYNAMVYQCSTSNVYVNVYSF